MFKVVWSPQAMEDLDSIAGYISDVLMVKDAASALIREIRHCIDNLQSFPAIGPRLGIPSEVQYRHLICGNYVIIYRIESGGIYIEKIAYKREDYIKLFIKDETMVHEDIAYFCG